MSIIPWLRSPVGLNNLSTYAYSFWHLSQSELNALTRELLDADLSGIVLGTSDQQFIKSIVWYPFNTKIGYEDDEGDYNFVIGPNITNLNLDPVRINKCYFYMGEYYVDSSNTTFIDYNGYTQMLVWLPYNGFVEIEPNQVIGKYIQFRLHIDYLSNTACWLIGVSDNSIPKPSSPLIDSVIDLDSGVRLIYKYECSLGVEIPVYGANYSEVARNLIMGTAKIAGAIALNNPALATSNSTTIYSYGKNRTVKARGAQKGSRLKTIKTDITDEESSRTRVLDYSNRVTAERNRDIFNASLQTLDSFQIKTNGDRINGSTKFESLSTSIHIVTIKPKYIPTDERFNKIYGKPLGVTKKLSQLNGYTEVGGFHLEGIPFGNCLEAEKDEIRQLLMSGIILPDREQEGA